MSLDQELCEALNIFSATFQWRHESPGLGKALLQHAPFLRMYADYIRNFDRAIELVRTWTERSSTFRNIIHDIQARNAHQNRVVFVCLRVSRLDLINGVMFVLLESGIVQQPHPAAPHAGTSPEGSTLWDATEGLLEEASWRWPRLWAC